MHRRLLDFGSHEYTSRQHEVRVGLAITTLQVESLEIDRSCRNRYLTEHEPFTQFLYQVGEPYSQTDELVWGRVESVNSSGMVDERAGMDVISIMRGEVEIGRHGQSICPGFDFICSEWCLLSSC